MKIKILIIFCFIGIFGYGQDHLFPKQELSQYDINPTLEYKNDSLFIAINNSLKSPLRFQIYTDNEIINKEHHLKDTLLLAPLESKTLTYYIPKLKNINYTFETFIGNPLQVIVPNEIKFPFPKGKDYNIIQGYNGVYSHNNDYNRYAIDFDLKVNDTISSVDDGVVIGVIENYKHGGSSKLWRDNDRSNFITIYHPHSGIYTQYGHLIYQGSLVKVGDEVEKGQPIALSGMTGFTNISHLHFNVLVPKKGQSFVSIPITFENEIKGEDLKIGDTTKH